VRRIALEVVSTADDIRALPEERSIQDPIDDYRRTQGGTEVPFTR
jgi:hypothetical protein